MLILCVLCVSPFKKPTLFFFFALCFSGAVFSRFILTGVWKNLIDVLSTPLTGRMAGSSKGLAFILGAEGVKEQSQRERDTICLSLDGLRKAAALSCALGVWSMFHVPVLIRQMHIIFSHPCGGGFVLPPYSTGKGQDYSLDICPTAGADSRCVQYEQ